MTTPTRQQLEAVHLDLDSHIASQSMGSDAQLLCFFDEETRNLYHVYVEGKEIFNLLSDTVIQALEREYSKFKRQAANDHNLDLAVSRLESEKDYAHA